MSKDVGSFAGAAVVGDVANREIAAADKKLRRDSGPWSIRIGHYKNPESPFPAIKQHVRQVPRNAMKPRRPGIETFPQDDIFEMQAKHCIAHFKDQCPLHPPIARFAPVGAALHQPPSPRLCKSSRILNAESCL